MILRRSLRHSWITRSTVRRTAIPSLASEELESHLTSLRLISHGVYIVANNYCWCLGQTLEEHRMVTTPSCERLISRFV